MTKSRKPPKPPTKAQDIGLKQLRALANLDPATRLDVIAEGLPILLSSAETLQAASQAAEIPDRVREILRGHALEEAAKVLILIDYARCPPSLSDRAQGQLRAFYDHGARLIYGQAASWKPVDVDMLRDYVDQTRVSHYVEGEVGEFILPNWELYAREARLYGDLSRTDTGTMVWNDPDQWSGMGGIFTLPQTALEVARSLSRVGAFGRKGLQIVHEVWAPHAFEHAEDHALALDLTRETLRRLDEAGLAGAANGEDGYALRDTWQMPMYAIDAGARPADLEALRAEQEGHLQAQY